jgi:hypothetical protein
MMCPKQKLCIPVDSAHVWKNKTTGSAKSPLIEIIVHSNSLTRHSDPNLIENAGIRATHYIESVRAFQDR